MDRTAPADSDPLQVRDLDGPDTGVRVLTLNRPARRNALDTGLLRRLAAELDRAGGDPRTRAILLRGEGPAFCAGGDVKEFAGIPDALDHMTVRARLLADVLVALQRHPHPVVAAVDGAALGGGAALALAADVVVATPAAEFGFPEFGASVVPTVVLPLLVRQVRPKLAFDLLTTGRRLDAAAALRDGLVSRVSAPGRHVTEALAVARAWAAVAPEVARETKRLACLAGASTIEDAMTAGLEVTAATWRPGVERGRASGPC